MALLHITLFFILSISPITQLFPSVQLYHEVIPVLPQSSRDCGLHALFNAFCFVTDTDHLDISVFKDFRKRFFKLHGRIPYNGIDWNALYNMREQLIPPDNETTCVLFLFKDKTLNKISSYGQELLQKIRWFHTMPAPKKLSIIFLYKHHYNTFNFYRDNCGTITLKVADSDFAAWAVHEQAQIIKEMILQGRYLAKIPAKKFIYSKKDSKQKRNQWVKIAHFSSLAPAKPLSQRPFKATLYLYGSGFLYDASRI